MTPALPLPSRNSTRSSLNTRINVGLVFKCAEIPMGHQYRRKNSPIGVPSPVRVRISFSSLLVLYMRLLQIDFTTKDTKSTKERNHLSETLVSFVPSW